jgi:hypothetical protein
MTRRELLLVSIGAPLGQLRSASRTPVIVPVRLLVDGSVKWRPELIQHFWSSMWPEAVREFGRCGIRLETSVTTGEVIRHPGREPEINGLDRGALNVVVTGRIPVEWDGGLLLSGVTTRYRGYHLCMIGLGRAHGHQIPLLSTNTCVHEILHALLHDIFESRPKGLWGEMREFRVDYYATRLWLFHDGAGIQTAARSYVERLRAGN